MVNLTLLSRFNPLLLRLAVLNVVRSKVLTALSWEPHLKNEKGLAWALSRAACSCTALHIGLLGPQKYPN